MSSLQWLKAGRISRFIYALIISAMISTSACSNAPLNDPQLNSFLDDINGPPEPLPFDDLMKEKADVIVLPSVSVLVWAAGAIIAYIGAQAVYSNSIEDFEVLLGDAFGQPTDWSWAESSGEPADQAAHLTESLQKVVYRSEESDFYSVTGNDYLRFLSMTSPATILDPEALKDLLDGKVRPWGRYAREYFAALQVASTQARHLSSGSEGQGLCARATVSSIAPPHTPYTGMARSRGAVDIIPAVVLASLKATVRCGMYDTDIREFVYGYFDVSDQRGSTVDIFISHSLKTAQLLFDYVEVCQLPPQIEIDLDGGECFDTL